MERTLSIIKPDGVEKNVIGEVIKRFETNGIKIAAMKMIHLSKSQAQGFYAVHKERPFFDSLTDFMTFGPHVVLFLEGYATDIEKNVVHGSDAPETAAFEIGYFFNNLELHSR